MANLKMRRLRAEVNDELARLNRAHDGLRPSEVVASAQPEASPLHNSFEWDDIAAGHEYRLSQARQLIRVSVIDASASPTGMPDRYVHVPSASGRGEGVYLAMSEVAQSDDKFARALAELMGYINGASKTIAELRAITEAADDTDRMMRIGMAVSALATAREAVAAVH